MGRFMNGVLIGVGLGLLVAPMKGDQMRRLMVEQYQQLRSTLPDNEQLQQAGQQLAAGFSQTAGTVKNAAQQATTKLQEASSSASDLAQQATSKVKQTGQGLVGKAKQTTPSIQQGQQASTTAPDEAAEDMIVIVETVDLGEGPLDLP